MAKPTSKPKVASATATSVPSPLMAVDNGCGYSNIRTDELDRDFRSILAPLSDATRVGDWPIDSVMNYDGNWLVFGEQAYTFGLSAIQERVSEDRYTSYWYQQLFAAALHASFYKLVGVGPLRPKVIASIPAMLYKQKGMKEKVVANLAVPYLLGNTYGGMLEVDMQPDNLTIIPEGIGTYWQHIFGPTANAAVYGKGVWMFLDLGFLTLDAVFVRDGVYMPDEAQSDSNAGVSKIADRLTEHIAIETGVRLHRAEIDGQMACDTIEVNRKPVRIAEVREEAVVALSKRIVQDAEVWARGNNLSGIVLTGGQASMIEPYLASSRLPPVTVARNHRRANVEGAYAWWCAKLGKPTT